MKALYPQEIEVFYLIPTIRRELAVQFKKQQIRQRKIAELLGVTEAAISQYINKKRASEVELGNEVRKEIEKAAGKISNPIEAIGEVQRILQYIKKTRLICKYHHKFMKGIPKDCSVCFPEENE